MRSRLSAAEIDVNATLKYRSTLATEAFVTLHDVSGHFRPNLWGGGVWRVALNSLAPHLRTLFVVACAHSPLNHLIGGFLFPSAGRGRFVVAREG